MIFPAVVMSPCRQGPTTHQSCQPTPTSLSSFSFLTLSYTVLHFTYSIFLSVSPTGFDLLSQRKLILDSVFQISNLSYYLSIIDYRRLFWRRRVNKPKPSRHRMFEWLEIAVALQCRRCNPSLARMTVSPVRWHIDCGSIHDTWQVTAKLHLLSSVPLFRTLDSGRADPTSTIH